MKKCGTFVLPSTFVDFPNWMYGWKFDIPYYQCWSSHVNIEFNVAGMLIFVYTFVHTFVYTFVYTPPKHWLYSPTSWVKKDVGETRFDIYLAYIHYGKLHITYSLIIFCWYKVSSWFIVPIDYIYIYIYI